MILHDQMPTKARQGSILGLSSLLREPSLLWSHSLIYQMKLSFLAAFHHFILQVAELAA